MTMTTLDTTETLIAALKVAKKHPPTNALLDEAISALSRAADEIERLREALRAITSHDAWRAIPIDTHNCHLAITACEELDDLARAALKHRSPK